MAGNPAPRSVPPRHRPRVLAGAVRRRRVAFRTGRGSRGVRRICFRGSQPGAGPRSARAARVPVASARAPGGGLRGGRGRYGRRSPPSRDRREGSPRAPLSGGSPRVGAAGGSARRPARRDPPIRTRPDGAPAARTRRSGMGGRVHTPAGCRGRGSEAPGQARIRASLRGRAARVFRGEGGTPARHEHVQRLRPRGLQDGAPDLTGLLGGRPRARKRRGTGWAHGRSRRRVPDGSGRRPGRLRGAHGARESVVERTGSRCQGRVPGAARPRAGAAAGPLASPTRGREPLGGVG